MEHLQQHDDYWKQILIFCLADQDTSQKACEEEDESNSHYSFSESLDGLPLLPLQNGTLTVFRAAKRRTPQVSSIDDHEEEESRSFNLMKALSQLARLPSCRVPTVSLRPRAAASRAIIWP